MSGFVLFLVVYYSFSVGLGIALTIHSAVVGPTEVGAGAHAFSMVVCVLLLIGTLIFLV